MAVVGFIRCNNDIVRYVSPDISSIVINFDPPLLPPDLIGVTVSNNLVSNEFVPGSYDIVYTTSEPDIGKPVVCSFNILVINGFQREAVVIAHRAFSTRVYDFVMEDVATTLNVLVSTPFAGDILSEDFAYGITHPVGRPFTVVIPAVLTATFAVRLTWCSSGQLSSASNFVSVAASVSLPGVHWTFHDRGSGATADGRCLRVWVESSVPITGRHSFS